jgi:hypothetical protein
MDSAVRRAWLGGGMVGLLTGAAMMGFVFYPPLCGWGDTVNGDKVAAWLSAIGTVGAVMVALGLALNDGWRRKRETRQALRRAGELMAMEIASTVVTLRVQAVYARRVLSLARNETGAPELVHSATEARLSALEQLPPPSQLAGVPHDFAMAVAALRTSAQGLNAIFNEVVSDGGHALTVPVIRRLLDADALLDALHRRLEDLAIVLRRSGLLFQNIDFLARGDGTQVPHSP